MTYRILLDNNYSSYSVNLEYLFDPLVQRKEDGRDRGYTTITNQDPEAARHFGFQPGESNPRLEWLIYDNGEDKSNGSLSSSSITDARFSNDTVTTVQEQIIWLTEYVHDNTSDARWILFGGRFSDRNGNGIDEGTNVVVKRTDHRRIAGQNAARGTVELKLGVTV